MRLPAHSQPWFIITRVSGIAATVGFLAVGVIGLLLAKRFGSQSAKGKLRPHRRLTELSVLALGVHIGAALLDRLHVPPYAVVAPFLSPARTVPAGFGSLALWGLLLVSLTGAGRRRFQRSWRMIHYLAYPAIGFAIIHSLLGSDRRQLAGWGALAAVALIGYAIYVRQQRIGVTLPSLPAADVPRKVLVHAGSMPFTSSDHIQQDEQLDRFENLRFAGPQGISPDTISSDRSNYRDRLADLGAPADLHAIGASLEAERSPLEQIGWRDHLVNRWVGLGRRSRRISGRRKRLVAAAVLMEVVGYGWLAIRIRRLAGSKSKRQ
jgi:DMSO/TMAO reductase YedYZ heme-binding membrane subunit